MVGLGVGTLTRCNPLLIVLDNSAGATSSPSAVSSLFCRCMRTKLETHSGLNLRVFVALVARWHDRQHVVNTSLEDAFCRQCGNQIG